MTLLIFCFYNIILSGLLLQVSSISNELFIPVYIVNGKQIVVVTIQRINTMPKYGQKTVDVRRAT